ncbi:MAG: hypothetical protein U1F43_37800 [Myxococcota bacterium]
MTLHLALALAYLLATASAAAAAPPEPSLVRASIQPLAVVALAGPDAGKVAPLGPSTPRGFGKSAGRLRFLAASEPLGWAIVELGAATGSGIFALPVDGGAPIPLADSHGVGFDVALSPDGRSLAYIDGNDLVVLDLARHLARVLARGAAAGPRAPGARLERPRWLDPDRVAFERSLDVSGSPPTTIEVATLAGATSLLVPHRGRSQDRLQAAFGDGLIAAVDGSLFYVDARHRTPVGTHFGADVHGVVPAGALVTLGESGVLRSAALAVVEPGGHIRSVRPTRPIYLDPLPTPDGARAAWTVAVDGGWAIEEVDLAGDPRPRLLGTAQAQPIELVAWTPDGRSVVGCRGDDIVAIDSAASGARGLRVLATATTPTPSCLLRAVVASAAGPVAVFDRRDAPPGDSWHVGFVPVAGGPATLLAADSSYVGAVAGHVIVSTGWEGSGAIVLDAPGSSGARVEVVPWQAAGIVEAYRDEAGATVVYRVGRDPAWLGARVAAPGKAFAVTGPSPRGMALNGARPPRAVGPQAREVRAYRVDGQDAAHPTVVLSGVDEVAPLARCAPVAWPASTPTATCSRRPSTAAARARRGRARARVAGFGGLFGHALELDPHSERVITVAQRDGQRVLRAAAIDGADADKPIVVATLERDFDGYEVTARGDVIVEYARQDMNQPKPYRWDVARSDGSSIRPASADEVLALRRQRLPVDTSAPSDGSERLTVLGATP